MSTEITNDNFEYSTEVSNILYSSAQNFLNSLEVSNENILYSTNALHEIICTEEKPFEIIGKDTCKENWEIIDIIEKKCELRFIKNETIGESSNKIKEQDIFIKNIEISIFSPHLSNSLKNR